jgi:DNA polymerase-3 subunit delta'
MPLPPMFWPSFWPVWDADMADTPLEDIPEPDRVEGAPHPRETVRVIGHDAAQADFLASFNTGRLHHGWLITGPRGVGKATLAWKIARFLLATPDDDGGMFASPPPATLDIPDDHPVARRLRALAEPRLFLLRRAWDEKKGKLQDIISVDEVRRMKSFFTLSAADGGRRVAIIDDADEMNPSAANALLKLLEEPPAGVTILLISHQPFRLLPTIRSRCRELRLSPLPPVPLSDALTQAGGDVDPADRQALAELAGGSVGEAFRLTNLDGLKHYAAIVALFATLPRMDRARAISLAEAGAGRSVDQFDLIVTLLDQFLARMARAGATGHLPPDAAPNEGALFTRLCPDARSALAWADLAQSLSIRARRGKAVNLDPAALLMDMVLKVDETAGTLPPR